MDKKGNVIFKLRHKKPNHRFIAIASAIITIFEFNNDKLWSLIGKQPNPYLSILSITSLMYITSCILFLFINRIKASVIYPSYLNINKIDDTLVCYFKYKFIGISNPIRIQNMVIKDNINKPWDGYSNTVTLDITSADSTIKTFAIAAKCSFIIEKDSEFSYNIMEMVDKLVSNCNGAEYFIKTININQ